MKTRALVSWSLLAMTASCTTVYAVLPAPSRAPLVARSSSEHVPGSNESLDRTDPLVTVDARIGHAALSASGDRTSYVLLEVTAAERGAGPAASDVTLVVDRSGSMRGERMANAIEAASSWALRAVDGDRLSVIAFDDRAEMVVSPTVIEPATRPVVLAAIRGLTAGGETCLSCGLEMASSLEADRGGRARRVVVLSDGEANKGVTSDAGFRRLASSFRERDVGITTLGLGLGYNEKLLGALAVESNGNHEFVKDAGDLPAVFAKEAESVRGTVAMDVTAEIEARPGVEIVRVLSRGHGGDATRVNVPLGALPSGAKRTVLLEVRVRGDVGPKQVVTVALRHRSPGGAERVAHATVTTEVSAGASSEMDARVAVRVERERVARSLDDANAQFAAGNRQAALNTLQEQRASLDAAARLVERARGNEEAGVAELAALVERLRADLDATRTQMARTSATSEQGRATVRETRRRWAPLML